MLALIDIDGTLLRTEATAHVMTLIKSASECSGIELERSVDWDQIVVHGRTDLWIVRQMLLNRGLSADDVRSLLVPIADRSAEFYPQMALAYDPPLAFAGANEALLEATQQGVRLALLTGNIESIAHAKILSAGYDANLFERFQGAFGSDAIERDHLVPFALRRAGYEQRKDEVFVVGDTPRDVQCAHAGGVRCIAVTTGAYDEQQLLEAGADFVIAEIAGLPELMRDLISDQ